ncbi:hypothetical protein EV188_11174 [Actinomycetospora succinea]|uniref:Uncharacterized protein n=1 Tax=Actinomycetospora succinea TaxID=663603 RepID=A0A4R6UYZ1_9PSEU|nr:hypothetical protein [Actinomycetospora succinea]TDQ48904.1 hypothetical protein EV188_11174 [Actinomycetospora succinea]
MSVAPAPTSRPEPDVSWRRRLITDLEMFLVVLAIGLLLGVLAALL